MQLLPTSDLKVTAYDMNSNILFPIFIDNAEEI